MKKVLFDKDICIVVQGPLTYPVELKKVYNNYSKNIIFSSNDEPNELSERFITLKNVFAPYPGRANFNNQVKNTYFGIQKAKQLGFEYVLKIRSDIFIDELEKFIGLIDKQNVYFPAFHLHDGGYLCDHMVSGPIDFMLKLWDIPYSNSSLAPETQLTRKYEELEDTRNINFLFPLLYDNNILAYWKKYDKYLNEYKNDKLFIYKKP